MRPLVTPRLTLEPLLAAHADEMFAVLADPAIYSYENQPPASLAWLRDRYARLESRRSADGSQQWLNWVMRPPAAPPIGYVQATVYGNGHALIGYEMASTHWGRGLASEAVEAMIAELRDAYGVTRVSAVLKSANERSLKLLQRRGFVPADAAWLDAHPIDSDERAMVRELR